MAANEAEPALHPDTESPALGNMPLYADLRRSEERYRLVLDNVDAVVYQTDAAGRWTFLNRAWTKLTGSSVEESLGADSLSYVHPDDRRRGAEALQGLLLGQRESSRHEIRYLTKDGGFRWTAVHVRATRDARGAICGSSGTLNDLTERKQAEEDQGRLQAAVSKAATEWQATFDAIESPLLIVDLEGRIRRMNRGARDLAGRDYRETIGRSLAAVGRGQPWAAAAEIVRNPCRISVRPSTQVRDDSAGRTWDIAASLYGGGETGEKRVILVVRDVTPMIALQESLRRSETMSALGSLVAGVAHEVRNPLFAISSTLDAFESRFGPNPEFSRYTGILRTELDRLAALMRDLLEYGRPSALDLAPGPIEDVIARAVRACGALAKRSNVRILNTVPGDSTPVEMDPRRLQEVFLNLIENAVQHCREGMAVTLSAPSNPAAEDWFECVVEDSGPGFRDEDLPHVFDPFFTHRKGGTGLGLSIARKIVEDHGGRIMVGNRPEGGAIVSVRLPRVRA